MGPPGPISVGKHRSLATEPHDPNRPGGSEELPGREPSARRVLAFGVIGSLRCSQSRLALCGNSVKALALRACRGQRVEFIAASPDANSHATQLHSQFPPRPSTSETSEDSRTLDVSASRLTDSLESRRTSDRPSVVGDFTTAPDRADTGGLRL